MYIQFGWGKNLTPDQLEYEAICYNLSLVSSGTAGGGLGNCVPGSLSVSLQVPIDPNTKPATDLFKYAKTQHDSAKTEGAGKIVVYQGRDVGQPIQVITFDKAWINNISSNVSQTHEKFSIQLSVVAGSIEVSDVTFEDVHKTELVA